VNDVTFHVFLFRSLHFILTPTNMRLELVLDGRPKAWADKMLKVSIPAASATIRWIATCLGDKLHIEAHPPSSSQRTPAFRHRDGAGARAVAGNRPAH